MKRSIIITLVMVLVFASVSFAKDIDGMRGSKWGSAPIIALDNENMLGGQLTSRGFNDDGLYELQFEVPMKMGLATSYYVFDKNDRLINAGIGIFMRENNWNVYYQNYNAIKDFLKDYLKTNPSFNSCKEIIIMNGNDVPCQEVKVGLANHIVFEDVQLENEFKSKKTNAVIKLSGSNSIYAFLSVHYSPAH